MYIYVYIVYVYICIYTWSSCNLPHRCLLLQGRARKHLCCLGKLIGLTVVGDKPPRLWGQSAVLLKTRAPVGWSICHSTYFF